MADRKVSELNAADAANLHEDALVHVVDLTEALDAQKNVKATVKQVRKALIHFGSVTGSAGSFAQGTPWPTGWSLDVTGANRCRITHNLGTTAYAIALTITQGVTDTSQSITGMGKTSTYFDVQTVYPAGSELNQPRSFDFMVLLG